MPFTPFHFGPGLLVKGIFPHSFSWTAFVATQVLIDCETLYWMAHNQPPWHRTLHTFIGATAVGAIVAGDAIGLKRLVPSISRYFERLGLSYSSEASTRGLIWGGLVGGASHPFLDGIMHSDIRPFAPFTDLNPLLRIISLDLLHIACIIAGITGFILLSRSTRLFIFSKEQ